MEKYRALQDVSVSGQVKVKDTPKMFTVADGVQVVVADLRGFAGNKAEIKATVCLQAGEMSSQGHIGIFVDGNIHPIKARDFSLDANQKETRDIVAEYMMENPKTHVQVRVSAVGDVSVSTKLDIQEMTLTPAPAEPIIGPIHPSLERPELTKESFLEE